MVRYTAGPNILQLQDSSDNFPPLHDPDPR